MSLSGRIRPGSEAAPWVVEEVKQLEADLAAAKSLALDLTKILLREGGVEGAYERRLAEAICERDAAREALSRIESVGDDGGMTGLDYGDYISMLRQLHTTLKDTNAACNAAAEHQREADIKAFATWLREVKATGEHPQDTFSLADAVEVGAFCVPLVTEEP